MKVRVDPSKCSAYGACHDTCPSVFELDEWGYAKVVGDGAVPAEHEAAARAAAAQCPENAIAVDEQVDLELTGKVALVTASSRGIGRAVAARLEAEGATVVVSARSVEPGERSLPADLTDAAQAAALVPAVLERQGRLDVLVVNTGGPPIRPFLETEPADWDAAYELLLRPAVLLAHAAATHMAERGSGAIVFLTSTWVRQPSPGGVLSASLRSAVSALAKQMALELAASGVRVNQVQPGATATERMQAIVAAKASANGTSTEEEQAKVARDIPLGRWADPDEIADAVAYLASARSSFVLGSALAVDGGAVRSVL